LRLPISLFDTDFGVNRGAITPSNYFLSIFTFPPTNDKLSSSHLLAQHPLQYSGSISAVGKIERLVAIYLDFLMYQRLPSIVSLCVLTYDSRTVLTV
jgi:hypothetical protein